MTQVDEDVTIDAAPTWAMVLTGVLAVVGVGISTYLTITHFEPQALACASNGIVNCQAVTTSAQSEILGIPVAILGLIYYVCAVPFFSPWAWRSQRRWVHLVRLVMAATSMAFVLWLITAELVIIGKICEWCTGVHIVTFVIFVTTLTTVPKMLWPQHDNT